MQNQIRRIGTVGTASRILVGLGLLYLALADGLSWGLTWREAGLGLVGFPAVMVALGLTARRFAGRPVRFMGPARARPKHGRDRRAVPVRLHRGCGRAVLRGNDVRRHLAGAAGVRGDGALELDPPARRPDRLPDLRADRRAGGRPERPHSQPRIVGRRLYAIGVRAKEQAVSPDTETDRRPESAERQERQAEMLASFGLLHLVACLGSALLVVIAINPLD
jgi:hypothetical protein